jgi:hypothetical protein
LTQGTAKWRRACQDRASIRGAGSPVFDYVCFENNPLLEAIGGGLTRYRFSDFVPREQAGYGSYGEALSEAGIGEAVCATSSAATGPSLRCTWVFPRLAPDDALEGWGAAGRLL